MRVIPVEGLALLLGVDRFMSEARSNTNFISNAVATIFLANNEKASDRVMQQAFDSQTLPPSVPDLPAPEPVLN